MKTRPPLVANLLMSSTLFLGLPLAEGEDQSFKIPADTTTYCSIEFPPRRDALSSDRPELEESGGTVVTSYGPCDYELMREDEIHLPRQRLLGIRPGQ
jgi:hypothetical protein